MRMTLEAVFCARQYFTKPDVHFYWVANSILILAFHNIIATFRACVITSLPTVKQADTWVRTAGIFKLFFFFFCCSHNDRKYFDAL